MGGRKIRCAKCGAKVTIPWLWVLGIEMIFYCKECRQHYKINYKLGAVLAGTGWALAFVSLQLIAWFTVPFSVRLAAWLFVPLGIGFSFLLRRAALKRRGRVKSDK